MKDSTNMKNINTGDFSFIQKNIENVEFVFSTAESGLNFNKSQPGGKDNLTKLKSWFKVENIGYLNQIHSSLIHVFDGTIHDGDSIVSYRSNIALGVFTADCVPILVADLNKGISAAIHSGWKGTLDCIVLKTLKFMEQIYNVNSRDLVVVIGPHIRSCCYEVSEDLLNKFKEEDIYSGQNISSGRMLDLEECIRIQLKQFSIPDQNIYDIKVCTCCSESYKMHSYRRNKEASGRMFSFVIVR